MSEPPAPQHERVADRGDTEPRIDRESLQAEFGEDEETADLVEFLSFARADLLEERDDLVVGTREGDTLRVRDRRHKLMPILRLAGPQPLRDLLEQAIDTDYAGDRAELATRIDSAITAAARLLQDYADDQEAR